ncbi:hypothetical protein K466DRAFT_604499 [Polyporus arcularius HHB13444]|uniref:Uncharacterized protein n=1 Tax=Polyporus arcularius HHB13444 TaxID=1314778 RepID=A0A5C3NVP6_9APHY|nr:hypothetical protein K466DRAFT_604499 [Polyporus arcularius HHB13444]
MTLSGKTFQEFVKEGMFVSLNKPETTYNLTAAGQCGLMSQLFIFSGRCIPIIFQNPRAASVIAGAGGVISNMQARGAATVLNQGVDPVLNTTIILGVRWDDDPAIHPWQIIAHDSGIPGLRQLADDPAQRTSRNDRPPECRSPSQYLVPMAVIDIVLGLNIYRLNRRAVDVMEPRH